MKKLLCLLCVAMMLLPVCAMAGAKVEAQHVAIARPYIGYASNSYVVITEAGYQAFDADGQPLCQMYPGMGTAKSGYYYTYSTQPDLLNGYGLMSGVTGEVLLHEGYFAFSYSDYDWAIGIVMEEAKGAECDYTSKSGLKLNIVCADVLHNGKLIGTLDRTQYLPSCTIKGLGDYLGVMFEDGACYYYNDKLELTGEYFEKVEEPQEYYFDPNSITHLPSLREAFAQGTSLTAEEVERSLLIINDEVVDVCGKVLGKVPSDAMDATLVGDWMLVRTAYGYSICDLAGNELIIAATNLGMSEAEKQLFTSGYQVVLNDISQVVFYDKEGNVTASSKDMYNARNLDGFRYNSPIVSAKQADGTYKLITATKGELDEVYEDVDSWYNAQKLISVKKDGLWGCVDIDGNLVVPAVHTDALDMSNDGTLVIGELADGSCVVYKISF